MNNKYKNGLKDGSIFWCESKESLEYMIKKEKIDINELDILGKNCLFYPASQNNYKTLIDNGICIKTTDING
jgi:hypothetical protein